MKLLVTSRVRPQLNLMIQEMVNIENKARDYVNGFLNSKLPPSFYFKFNKVELISCDGIRFDKITFPKVNRRFS